MPRRAGIVQGHGWRLPVACLCYVIAESKTILRPPDHTYSAEMKISIFELRMGCDSDINSKI
jgi:hypothetical protein